MIFDWLFGKALHTVFGKRGDGLASFRYPPISSFGVKTKPFSFYSDGTILNGDVAYPTGKPLGLIVFFHGLGAGYTAYSQEIAFYASQGYLVYAYDYHGCMTSLGRDMIDLGHPLIDQKAFFAFLDKQIEAKGLTRYSIGHSWGGYLSSVTLAFPKYQIEKAISFAGFLDIPSIILESAPSLKKMKGKIGKYFAKRYGAVAGQSVIEVARTSQKPLLYIQGDEDNMVPYDDNLVKLQSAGLPNVKTVVAQGRGHQPYWKNDSYHYFQQINEQYKPGSYNRDPHFVIDYRKLQQDDPIIMKSTIDFLKLG